MLKLISENKQYNTFTYLEVKYALRASVHSCIVTFPKSFANEFKLEQEFNVFVDKQIILVGSVTKIRSTIDAISIVIKSQTKLIENTANKTIVFENATISDILSNSDVIFEFSVNPVVSKFSIHRDETYAEILDRLAVKSNFIYYSIAERIVIMQKKKSRFKSLSSDKLSDVILLQSKKNNCDDHAVFSNENFYKPAIDSCFLSKFASNATESECNNIADFFKNIEMERRAIFELTYPLRDSKYLLPGGTVIYFNKSYYISSVKYLVDKNNLEQKICLIK